MKYKAIEKIIKKYESKSMLGQLPILWESAEKEFIISNKIKFLDFTSTIFVSNIGHSNKTLIKKINHR